MVFGGSYGEGVLFRGSKADGYFNSVGGSWGLQAGAQSYGYAVFLMTNKAVDYLRQTKGWEIGVGPTVVVVEGLLMYFPEERVVALLCGLAARLAPGSRVVFTCMTAGRGGRLGFPAGHPLIDRWLRHQREVFRWGIAAEQAPAFLARVGLRLLAHDEAESLARRFLPAGDPRRGAHGEAVLVGEPCGGPGHA